MCLQTFVLLQQILVHLVRLFIAIDVAQLTLVDIHDGKRRINGTQLILPRAENFVWID